MRVIFTHSITDDTGTLTVGLIRLVVELYHGVEYTALYGLKSVTNIRQGTGSDYTHGVINVILLHGLFHVYFLDLVKNFVIHNFFLFFTLQAFILFLAMCFLFEILVIYLV